MDNLTSKAPRSDKLTTMTGYSESIVECFDGIPDVARPLIGNAERLLKKIEKMLYSAPAFIGTVRAAIPEEAYQVILTDEQKAKIADGALKLMTKKDGSLMATLKSLDIPIVKNNAVAVLTATALPAYQAGRLFLLRRCHAVKGTVRPAFQRRQVFIGVISHAFPPFCFPLPFSPKRFPAPFLRRIPNRGPRKVVRLCGERSRSGASELSPSGGSE